ncbi:MAG: hypothetical protein ABFD45_08650 [Smithella sp.]
MNILFEPSRIRKIHLRNRFVRSATCDGMAQTSGHVSSSQIKLIADLAAGGVGLIIHAITYVHLSGQVSSFMNSLADDELIPGMKKLTEAVHHGTPLYCVAFSKNKIVPARRHNE